MHIFVMRSVPFQNRSAVHAHAVHAAAALAAVGVFVGLVLAIIALAYGSYCDGDRGASAETARSSVALTTLVLPSGKAILNRSRLASCLSTVPLVSLPSERRTRTRVPTGKAGAGRACGGAEC